MTVKPGIKVTKNGPYIVSDSQLREQTIITDEAGGSIDWSVTREFAVGESYALCRCGLSRNKPFCDGSHVAAGFVGTESRRDLS